MKKSKKSKPLKEEPKTYVILKSKDGDEFIVEDHIVKKSEVLKEKIEKKEILINQGENKEEKSEKVVIDLKYSKAVVEKLIDYFMYKETYYNNPKGRPEFDIEENILLDLTVAANELKI